MADLLNIGASGLAAAQAGLATTSHNISNANVDGYSRQQTLQATAVAQRYSYGFVGNGTTVTNVQRIYDNYLGAQVNSAQSTTSSLDTYTTQIGQVDDLLSDTSAGLSPALQDFYSSLQDLSSSSSSTASRQAVLSNADTLAARFQSMAGRLNEISDGVTSQISTSIDAINTYASQIASLNQSISALSAGSLQQPNDLLDQRDQLVTELNKYVSATTSTDSNGMLTVSIGSGTPLVVGTTSYKLAATTAPTDPTRIEVGYTTGTKVTAIAESTLTGGSLGGLLQFRSDALDVAQNSLGRVAIALASATNAQSELGQDAKGALGTAMFSLPAVSVVGSTKNNSTSTTAITATITDATALTTSNYTMKYNGSNFVVTRASDGQQTTLTTNPQVVDGVSYNISGTAATGDNFEVKPTANGASGIQSIMTDVTKVAAAAPISTAVATTNTGDVTISAGSVDATYLQTGNQLTSATTMTYDKTAGTLSFSPATQDVTLTTAAGVATTYPAGTAVPFTSGATLSFGGVNLALTGTPGNGDTYTVGPNTSGVGDNRNGALLAGLQTAKLLDGGTANFSDAYAAAVSDIGNKDRAAQVQDASATALLAQTTAAQQSVSGVNLDEEAANLLQYQQAYQASGKVMQIASTLFDTLLSLGQ